MIDLSADSLPEDGGGVKLPRYDRSAIRPGIVHIGVGGFHRAHQAAYMDDLMNDHGVTDWGIAGCGILPHDAAMSAAMQSQKCRYTVVERDELGDSARVIGSIIRYVFGPANPDAIVEAMASPETKIVSLTITEGGYPVDHATGAFLGDLPDIRHDLANPKTPKTAFGYIAEALQQRIDRQLPPFTVMSCDNLQSNGAVARNAVVSYANLRSDALAEWIDKNVPFPNCMVDRITPQTTDAHRALVHDRFGIADAWPVVCEPFRQWVIEDKFVQGRPPLDLAGAQFVPDVHPYELMKIRLLNASHSAMGYLGYLAGYRTIDAVIKDPQFRLYIQELMDEDVTPLLQPVPGIDLPDYKRTLIHRFGNPAIGDQVLRICLDGSSKMPKFILPSIAEATETGKPFTRLALCVAAWIRFLTGLDEDGNIIPVQDPKAERLQQAALAGRQDPRPVLSLTDIFGDLGTRDPLVHEVTRLLDMLYKKGAHDTLRTVNERT
jgi:mannitol 2-dehydrogenase